MLATSVIRRANDRGHFNHGWLETSHTFSFADYYDPDHMGFRALRVINEDHIQPGRGFGMHGHRDMEIITYVLSGELQHQDSLGNGAVLRAGELQHMTAGTGIRHSEFNPSSSQVVHLYQIWLLPERTGLTPHYAQRSFDIAAQRGRWQLVASPDGREGSFSIGQDARVQLAQLESGQTLGYAAAPSRHGWLQVLRGSVTWQAPGHEILKLDAGDGLAISDTEGWQVAASQSAELLLFDLA